MAHKLVTDAMVENAMLAFKERPGWKMASPALIENERCLRAALEAVADDLIEACAMRAEEAPMFAYRDPANKHLEAHLAIAKAIRSLKSQGQ